MHNCLTDKAVQKVDRRGRMQTIHRQTKRCSKCEM
jgi:hypothetical protein